MDNLCDNLYNLDNLDNLYNLVNLDNLCNNMYNLDNLHNLNNLNNMCECVNHATVSYVVRPQSSPMCLAALENINVYKCDSEEELGDQPHHQATNHPEVAYWSVHGP